MMNTDKHRLCKSTEDTEVHREDMYLFTLITGIFLCFFYFTSISYEIVYFYDVDCFAVLLAITKCRNVSFPPKCTQYYTIKNYFVTYIKMWVKN